MDQQHRIERAISQAASLPWRTRPGARLAKRLLDLAISAPATLAALPVMGVVAAVVRLSDPGPVLFRQTRVGLDGEPFTMWKFRTMRIETAAGAVRDRMEVTRSDPRLIPGGALLRDWRLDELPQLFQVLTGKMSLVGPRPDLPDNLAAYADEHLVRFAMPPGCTAWTFTRGAFANAWSERQAINAEYVARWSVMLDLEILLGTIKVLLAQRDTSPPVAEIPGAHSSKAST